MADEKVFKRGSFVNISLMFVMFSLNVLKEEDHPRVEGIGARWRRWQCPLSPPPVRRTTSLLTVTTSLHSAPSRCHLPQCTALCSQCTSLHSAPTTAHFSVHSTPLTVHTLGCMMHRLNRLHTKPHNYPNTFVHCASTYWGVTPSATIGMHGLHNLVQSW